MATRDGIKKFRAKLNAFRNEYPKLFQKIVKASCQEMVVAAAEATPPLNGEDRGKNTVTGSLAAHWGYEINEGLTETRITLYNDMQYASYVDQGHRMDEHFVPWLYIDGMGSIARHIPVPGEKLFGLVVGNKTEYVKGYGMVDKAKQRFDEALRVAYENLIDKVEGQLNGD